MKLPASFLLLTTSLLSAAPLDTTKSFREFSVWELLVSAGWVMIPLFAVSVAAMSLIIYYFLTLQRSRIASDEFRRALEPLIREKNFGGLLEATRANPQTL